jgi:hypothetical protein
MPARSKAKSAPQKPKARESQKAARDKSSYLFIILLD